MGQYMGVTMPLAQVLALQQQDLEQQAAEVLRIRRTLSSVSPRRLPPHRPPRPRRGRRTARAPTGGLLAARGAGRCTARVRTGGAHGHIPGRSRTGPGVTRAGFG